MSESTNRRRTAGNTTTTLVLLLSILVGAGAWNYLRNVQLERESKLGRAYSGYSTREVELLRDAVAGELEASRVRFERAKNRRMGFARDQGSLAANARQLDRTARASDAIQDAASTLAENQSLKSALDEELALRSQRGTGTALHLKRLTSF